MDKFDLEVHNALQELRIPAHLKGYELIKSAMKIIRDDPNAIYSIGKIYEAVAQEYGTTHKAVSSGIRNALQSAKSDYHDQKRILGTNRELCNAEFLATLAEVVRLKLVGAA
ncbi:sporulation initiation factor Spo0A C-terminal domain-containing protein [Desulfosporosinus nitroreducens]|uniref:sporulation initiation factor Spo0A C-terminal domain-containing protein n=1 Tax=Desulfosporosinus nitroreducens TaxID=2018668 RepID=UPI00207D6424|nr:sporulation initiation factor Spo0A C-terminal domain-containing protein [Desulfosporosinus nitroreducens]MCO1599858.1 sporulation initiation factor Spo0A C-terminal domain-containing protein [Desulfosporosinus nitroreducens]